MFNFGRLVQFRKPAHRPDRGRSTGSPLSGAHVRLIAITDDSANVAALQRIAVECHWRMSVVASSEAAIALLNEQPTPLVICDRDLAGEDWRDVLAKIGALPEAVCVLLASRVVDDYLWRQVIRNHGYDLVSKPFQPEELRRAVMFAWSWRGWALRHHREVLDKPTA